MVNKSKIICPNCSALLPPNAKFCTECGTLIQQTTNNQRITNEDPIESIKASSKDFMNEMGSLFQSVNSNPKQPTKQKYCPKCHIKFPLNKKFCTKCGTTLKKEENQRTQQEKSPIDKLEYLEKLADLKDKGIISEEEFEKKKKDILKI